MNMKKWTTPMAVEENYAGNAAVAESACYRIKCDTQAADSWELGHPQDTIVGTIHAHHKGGHCGDYDSYVISVNSSTHKITSMEEVHKVAGFTVATLPCTFYDKDFANKISSGDLKSGDRVYWRTNMGGIEYSHQGNLEAINPAHSNRS